MSDLYYKGKFTNVPDSWNELSASQFVQAIDVLILQQANKTTKQIKLLKILTGWSWWHFVGIMQWFKWNPLRLIRTKLSNASLSALQSVNKTLNRTERLAFASEEVTRFFFESITITNNLIPVVYPGGRHPSFGGVAAGRGGLFGPAHELGNMVMSEYVYAENYFNQWKETKEHRHLNSLISVLYRPAKKQRLWLVSSQTITESSADIRIPFDPNTSAAQIKYIETWPLALRIAIGTMYGSMRQQKIDENPKVFSEPASDDGNGGNLYGLWSIMRQIAKAGHFGQFKDIENTYVDTVLMELNESIAEAERHEAELERMKDRSP